MSNHMIDFQNKQIQTQLATRKTPNNALDSHTNGLNRASVSITSSPSRLIRKMQATSLERQPFALLLGLAVILNVLFLHRIDADRNTQVFAPSNQNAVLKDLSGPASGKIQTLDVICGKNFMTVRAEFSGPFYGIVFSKGTYGHENCIYVKPNSGLTHAAFNVYYDQCGTKPDLQKKFYENTIVIQYGSDIIEAYDEAKRLRCEWFEAYEKPATFKPAIPVADLEVVEMNFQGDDIDCWMEIQDGMGPLSREVTKIVPVGQPMTIVVAINDYNGQFDMRVKSCVAHDGVQQPIALTDEFGCVLRPKMITPFSKIKNPNTHKRATILSYARFLAFKFPDSMNVQIQCTVEVCRHGCADACQRVASVAATTLQPELSLSAKWPAAANQPNIEASQRIASQQAARLANPLDSETVQESQFRPSRVAINNNPQEQQHQQQPQQPQRQLDDMSGSDSSKQVSVVHSPGDYNQQSQQPSVAYMDSRVPQYLAPAMVNLRRVSQQPPRQQQQVQVETTITTTYNSASTTTITSSTTAAPTTLSAATSSTASSPSSSSSGPVVDTNAESYVVDERNQGNQADNSQDSNGSGQTEVVAEPVLVEHNSRGSQQPSEAASSPSVGSYVSKDDELELNKANLDLSNLDTNNSPQSSPSSSSSQQSSIKTVEVEIPSNTDDMQVAASSLSGSTSGQPQPGEYSAGSVQLKQNSRRDKNQDQTGSALDDMYQASASKIQFGARSQPSSVQQSAAGSELASQGGPANHQMAGANNVDPDKQLSERSDEMMGSESVVSVVSAANPKSSVAEEASSKPQVSSAEAELVASDAKLQPVVGTDELATGPVVQIENRMGPSAPKSLEDALSQLQHQIPQSAALVSDQDASLAPKDTSKPADSSNGQTPSSSSSSSSQTASDQNSEASDRFDRLAPSALDPSKLRQKVSQMQHQQNQHNLHHQARATPIGMNQPFPNVAGQTKVIPDPASSRNPHVHQTSNQEPGLLVAQASSVAQVLANPQLPAHLDTQTPRGVAQITNVPMGIGFPPQNIQVAQHPQQQQTQPQHPQQAPQLTLQQMALIQQHQQQQQQQLHKNQQQQQQSQPTTQKPSRGRFNLLSPHAALQAVASRILPKSFASQQSAQVMPKPASSGLFGHKFSHSVSPATATTNALPIDPTSGSTGKPVVGGPFQLPTIMQQQQPQPQALQQQLPAPLAVNNPQRHLFRSRRSAIAESSKGRGEMGISRSFMVVTGMDLAFNPNASDAQLPPILEGKRAADVDVVYGVCLPVVSLAFVLTCLFWLVMFLLAFSFYLLIRIRRQRNVSEVATKLDLNG